MKLERPATTTTKTVQKLITKTKEEAGNLQQALS